jgi:phosphoribosyl 1,2-cyclic phosphodiesterase
MIALTVLASGSQGNCTALEFPGAGGRLVLVDAGISPKAAKERLFTSTRRSLDEATDLLLTHLDADHWRETWRRPIERTGMRVHVHAAHQRAALGLGVPPMLLVPFEDGVELAPGISMRACRTPHDEHGSTAMRFDASLQGSAERASLGFATDLGAVHDRLLEHFDDLDALAIESNYDRALELASERPWFLKERIMGGSGHLSNDESLRAARVVAERGSLQAIVLLHLSQQCNRADLVEELWRREAPELVSLVVLAEQHRPTRTVHVRPSLRRGQPPAARRRAPLVPHSLFEGCPSEARPSLFGPSVDPSPR